MLDLISRNIFLFLKKIKDVYYEIEFTSCLYPHAYANLIKREKGNIWKILDFGLQ